MATSRTVGDRLNGRFGPVALARGGGLLAAPGLALGLITGSTPAGHLGFLAMGAGLGRRGPGAVPRRGLDARRVGRRRRRRRFGDRAGSASSRARPRSASPPAPSALARLGLVVLGALALACSRGAPSRDRVRSAASTKPRVRPLGSRRRARRLRRPDRVDVARLRRAARPRTRRGPRPDPRTPCGRHDPRRSRRTSTPKAEAAALEREEIEKAASSAPSRRARARRPRPGRPVRDRDLRGRAPLRVARLVATGISRAERFIFVKPADHVEAGQARSGAGTSAARRSSGRTRPPPNPPHPPTTPPPPTPTPPSPPNRQRPRARGNRACYGGRGPVLHEARG
jgi:hypothetical protein